MNRIAAPNQVEDKKARSSVNAAIDVLEHYNIDVDKLIPYHKQARKNFNEEEIKGLAQSIQEHGIRQPLTIIQSLIDPALYEVASGERRLRAAKLLGMKKVPCILVSDTLLAEEIALVENIQRQNLHPIEMGDAFSKMLHERNGLTQQDLARKLGISNKVISECVRFSHLPAHVKSYLIEKNVTGRELLRKLLKMENPERFVTEMESNSTIKNTSKTSVIRISLIDGNFNTQSSGISELNPELKVELRSLLLRMCEKL